VSRVYFIVLYVIFINYLLSILTCFKICSRDMHVLAKFCSDRLSGCEILQIFVRYLECLNTPNVLNDLNDRRDIANVCMSAILNVSNVHIFTFRTVSIVTQFSRDRLNGCGDNTN